MDVFENKIARHKPFFIRFRGRYSVIKYYKFEIFIEMIEEILCLK